MPKRRGQESPIIFRWQVVDVIEPEKKIFVQFHAGGLVTLKHDDLELNVSNARILGNLLKSHVIKKFSSFHTIKKEFDTIRDVLASEKESNAA